MREITNRILSLALAAATVFSCGANAVPTYADDAGEAAKAASTEETADPSASLSILIPDEGGSVTITDAGGTHTVTRMDEDITIIDSSGAVTKGSIDDDGYCLVLPENAGGQVTLQADAGDGYEISEASYEADGSRSPLSISDPSRTDGKFILGKRNVFNVAFVKKAVKKAAEKKAEEIKAASGTSAKTDEKEETAADSAADWKDAQDKDSKSFGDAVMSGETAGHSWYMNQDGDVVMDDGTVYHPVYPSEEAVAEREKTEGTKSTPSMRRMAARRAAAAPSKVPASYSGACSVVWRNNGTESSSFGLSGFTGVPADATSGLGTVYLSCADHTAAAPEIGMACSYQATLQSWDAASGTATYSMYVTPPGATDGVSRNEYGLLGYQHMSGIVTLTFQTNGKIMVRKVSSDSKAPMGNGYYSYQGCQYTVYADKACTRAVATLNVGVDGKSNEADLSTGTYYLKETAVGSGMGWNRDVKQFSIASGDYKEITMSDPVSMTRIAIQKVSSHPEMTDGNSQYSFKGAVYGVFKSKTDTTPMTKITLDDKGYGESGAIFYVNEIYYVKELVPPNSGTYDLDDAFLEVKTTEQGKIVPVKASENPVVDSMEIAIEKKGGCKGGKSLEGAEFTVRFYKGIYSKDSLPEKADRTWVIRTKKEADGTYKAKLDAAHKVSGDSFYIVSGKVVLPLGTVTVEETKAPEGYLNDGVISNGSASVSGVYVANIRKDSNTVKLFCGGTMIRENGFTAKDTPITGGVKVYKRDNETGRNDPQGDAKLSGAKFEIVSRNSYNVEVAGKVYGKDEVVKTIVTDEKGFAAAGMHDLPYGDYVIREAEGGEPTGYLGKGVLSRTFSIREDGKMIDLTEPDQSIRNDVMRGGVEIQKVDADWRKASAQGDAALEGAVYAIVSKNPETVLVNGREYAAGETVMTIRTGADGKAKTGNRDLPYGTYEVHETDPSTGYLVNSRWSETFRIREDEKIVSLTEKPCPEDVIRGGVQMQKKDLELDKAEAPGGASLAGIEFQITNKSKQAVRVNGKDYEPGKVVASVYTDEKGIARSAVDLLPYGTYTIQEVASDDLAISANDSYLLTDGKAYTFRIREDGKIVSAGIDGKTLEVKDQVKRNDISFRKVEDGTDRSMGLIPFVIEQTATHEKHVVVVDKNGKYSSTRYAHSRKTNSMDYLLEKYGEDDVIPESELSYKFGTWFGLGQKGSKAEIDDALPAFPYGTYTITELPCENNEGYELIKNYTFTVEEDHSETNEEPVDLYNLHNIPTTPEISTRAFDSETGEKISLADNDVKITDVVTAKKLQKDHTYILKATLVDQETGNALRTKNSNGSHVTVTGSTKFNADKSSMEIKVPLDFDAADLAGKSVVVFEKLYRVEDNGTEVLAAEHTDLGDAAQTVRIPSIHTTASDGQTGDAVGLVGKHAEIIDKVAYTNLIPGKKYTIRGVLMDKETGEAFLSDNGRAVTAETSFTPEESDGTEEMKFRFSSIGLEGKKLVVFETMTLGGKEIAIHRDLEDIGQTVSYLDLHTHAEDGQTKEQTGTIGKTTLVDTVVFKNLVIGKEYTITGTLMNKATAEELKDADGHVITAVKTFKAEAESGEQQLTFTFDSSLLAGKDLVAFEKITHNGIDIATHADISDEAQTVHYPEIHTSAAGAETGDHFAEASEKTTIIDTVMYKNLLPETEYVLKGVLMDKASGNAVKSNGKEVTAEAVFTTGKAEEGKSTVDGTVEVKFVFDARELDGAATVVFEKLYRADQEIAAHEDLTDEDQTVVIPAIHTSAVNGETGTHTGVSLRKTTVEDTVTYRSLVPGQKYVLKGHLVDKATGKAIDGTEETETFNAKDSEGEAVLKFTVNGSELAGKTTVAFEHLYHDGKEIAVHADLSDEGQSVHFPAIHTSAAVGGSREVEAKKDITITDTVSYEGLIAGHTYTVKGRLMDKETGKELTVNGKAVKGSATFTAQAETGTLDVKFSLDGSALGGKTLVVFEDLYEGEQKIAEHADIDDTAQAVVITKPQTPSTPSTPNKNSSTPKSAVSTATPPKTGDTSNMVLYAVILAAAGTALMAALKARKKKNS